MTPSRQIWQAAFGLIIVAAAAHAQPVDTVSPAADDSSQSSEEAPSLNKSAPRLHASIAPYIWLTGFSGDVTVKGVEVDATASFLDILDASDSVFGLMGALDVEYERFVFQLNGAWSVAEISKAGAVATSGTLTADIENSLGWYEFFGGYRIIDKPIGENPASARRFALDGFAGIRYTDLDIDTTLNASTSVTLPNGEVLNAGESTERNTSQDWFEPYVGARMAVDLTDHWVLSLRGDLGGFGVSGSDFSWQAVALAGYRWHMDGWNLGLFGGYRALSQDYSDGDFAWDQVVHGPMMGAQFAFAF